MPQPVYSAIVTFVKALVDDIQELAILVLKVLEDRIGAEVSELYHASFTAADE